MGTEKNLALENLYKSIQTFGSISIAAESRDKLYRYNDALMQSLYSILEDRDSDESVKLETFNTTMEQYTAAMKDLFPKLISSQVEKSDEPPAHGNPVSKADPNRYDEIVEVEKFNPYHDRLGRFATSNGFMNSGYSGDKDRQAVTFSANPETRAGAMAIARESNGETGHEAIGRAYGSDVSGLIDRFKKPKSKNPGSNKPDRKDSDKDTLAGVKRGEPMSREQANEGRVNPNYGQGPGYSVNCQSCVVAFEARLRGYDVQTKPNSKNPTAASLSRDTRLAWKDPATGEKPDYITNEKVTTAKRCKAWMEETIQPGERYTFQHGWKGRKYTGHIISADKDSSGNLRLYDPQNGKTMQGADIDSYLSRTKLSMTILGTKLPRAKLIRVDNLEIDPSVASGIMEATKS
ncbi:MAG: toxin glutamine deamidase domain-containing protein [Faecousia sp.]